MQRQIALADHLFVEKQALKVAKRNKHKLPNLESTVKRHSRMGVSCHRINRRCFVILFNKNEE